MDMALTCLVVFAAWTFGGVIGGVTGIGALMLSMPFLTMVLTPLDAVLVSTLIGVYGVLHLGIAYRKSICWRDIRDMVIGVLPGTVAGTMLLKVVSMQTLQLMVCAMLATFVIIQCCKRLASYTLPESALISIIAGFICGAVGGSVAMVGAPLGIYILMKHWDPNRARANMSGFYLFTSLSALFTQYSAGLYTLELIPPAISGMIGCALGSTLGVRLGRHVDQKMFTRLVVTFLALAAVMLFWRAMGW